MVHLFCLIFVLHAYFALPNAISKGTVAYSAISYHMTKRKYFCPNANFKRTAAYLAISYHTTKRKELYLMNSLKGLQLTQLYLIIQLKYDSFVLKLCLKGLQLT